MIDNLYAKVDRRTGKRYFTYRDPRTGKFHGLGTDQESAESDARALNASIYASIRSAKIAAIHAISDTVKFHKVITRHHELCVKRKLSPNTMRTKHSTSRAWEKELGPDTPIGDITVRKLVEVLAKYEDRPRMAQAMRSAAIDIWKDAIQEGWISENIPERTRASSVEVQRSRLTLDDFHRIHAVALKQPDKWIARSMELALVTSQRREDISMMEFRQGNDSSSWIEGNFLCIIQGKTKVKIRIPLNIGVAGFTVDEVIRSCRDSAVSKWIVHHNKTRTLSKSGDQVWKDTLSKGFARVRDLAGVTGESGKTPPSFHEIRSLSIRLYAEAYGPEFAQAMAGHKDPSMTAVYRDVRGAEWLEIKV